MNSVPTILTDQGFEVDNNGVLTEMVIPHTVVTCDAPRKITFNGDSLTYIPSTATVLQEFSSDTATSVLGNLFQSFTALKTLKLNGVAALNNTEYSFCRDCTNLDTIEFGNLISINVASDQRWMFYNCSALTSVYMPKLTTVTTRFSSGVFYNCSALETINLPSLNSVTGTASLCGLLNNCTALNSITVGSVGNPVASLVAAAFAGCTSPNLHIVVYVQDPQNPIANAPWGATNATYEFLQA